MQRKALMLLLLLVGVAVPQNFTESLTSKLQCTLYYAHVPAFGFGYCITQDHKNYSVWSTCSQSCCSSLQTLANSSVPSSADIQNCREEKTAPNMELIIELSSAFSGLVVLTVTAFIVYNVRLRQPEGDPQFDLAPHEEKELTASPLKLRWLNRAIEKMSEQDKIKSQLSKERLCPLCFNLVPIVEAHCMHSYHIHCAVKLIEQGNQCRLCQKWMGKYLRIHCFQCHRKYFVIKKTDLQQFGNLELCCHDCIILPSCSKEALHVELGTVTNIRSPTQRNSSSHSSNN